MKHMRRVKKGVTSFSYPADLVPALERLEAEGQKGYRSLSYMICELIREHDLKENSVSTFFNDRTGLR